MILKLFFQHKTVAIESADDNQPSTYAKLKERVKNARNSLNNGRTTSSRYNDDPDLRAITSEVEAIKNARKLREENLVSIW